MLRSGFYKIHSGGNGLFFIIFFCMRFRFITYCRLKKGCTMHIISVLQNESYSNCSKWRIVFFSSSVCCWTFLHLTIFFGRLKQSHFFNFSKDLSEISKNETSSTVHFRPGQIFLGKIWPGLVHMGLWNHCFVLNTFFCLFWLVFFGPGQIRIHNLVC